MIYAITKNIIFEFDTDIQSYVEDFMISVGYRNSGNFMYHLSLKESYVNNLMSTYKKMLYTRVKIITIGDGSIGYQV